jgi:hypothetical protein
MTNEERLMQRLQQETEARIIAERRARAFSQANDKLREKLAALARLTADHAPARGGAEATCCGGKIRRGSLEI